MTTPVSQHPNAVRSESKSAFNAYAALQRSWLNNRDATQPGDNGDADEVGKNKLCTSLQAMISTGFNIRWLHAYGVL